MLKKNVDNRGVLENFGVYPPTKHLFHKCLVGGFTILELLLYLAVVPFILLSISTFFFSFPEARIKNKTIMETEEQGAHIMNLITQSIRNAESITAPLSGTSASALVLDVVNVSDDPTIFDAGGSVIQITEGASSPIALTNSRVAVSDLVFQNLSRPDTPGIVRVQFTLQHINTEGRYEYNYQKTFYGSANVR